MPAGVALWRLLQISDQLFPTGAYAFSHALETYVDRGMVHDRATCQPLFEALCDHALGPCDAVFCRHAFRAAAQDNMARLMELDHLLTASKVTQELRLESEHTGQAFLRASLAMQPPPLVEDFWRAARQKTTPGNHAITFGLVAQGLGVSETCTVQSYLYNVVAGWVSVAVRLVPLGQMDGQRLLFDLTSRLGDLMQRYRDLNPEDTWSNTLGLDIRSMQHERLYSRLFRS
ncbi:urease accessory protein UreF [Candidatus Entotheonella palauensis]|uniref:urease accessory protein UreF n=1 Tax=Candidatus Entotheonella palauensis TaxID=93172 RepID=UPI0015C41911|nr:urease accessory protein UreF [Candidatus Entotheonella palauensis]